MTAGTRPGAAAPFADAATVAGWIERLADQIGVGDETRAVTLVGIPRRGRPLADRIAAHVRARGRACVVTEVDPTLWRDDFDAVAHRVSLEPTLSPAEIEGRHLVIVDDVLMTGRTIRAALDHLMQLGRPARVELAVLLDRGGREVPIQPDYVGIRHEVPRERTVEFRIAEVDGEDAVLIEEAGR